MPWSTPVRGRPHGTEAAPAWCPGTGWDGGGGSLRKSKSCHQSLQSCNSFLQACHWRQILTSSFSSAPGIARIDRRTLLGCPRASFRTNPVRGNHRGTPHQPGQSLLGSIGPRAGCEWRARPQPRYQRLHEAIGETSPFRVEKSP